MRVLKARVKNGHLTVVEPTSLPEGSEVALMLVHPEDAMGPEGRARLEAAIARGMADAQAGRGVDMEAFLDELESTR